MNERDTKAHSTPLGAVVAKASSDSDFKKRLLTNPAAVLTAEGVVIPSGMTVKVVENTAELVHLVLPVEGELSEAALANAVGGIGIAHPIYRGSVQLL